MVNNTVSTRLDMKQLFELVSLKILAMCFILSWSVQCDVNISANNSHYVQQTFNLIENIINLHDFNIKFWFIVFIDDGESSDSFSKFLPATFGSGEDKPKIIYHGQNINSTQSRDFAVVYFISGKENIGNQLKLCTKFPPDIPKIYIDLRACQLNESQLAESMKNLWEFDEIAFIYYISFCIRNYETIDDNSTSKATRAVSNTRLEASQRFLLHHLGKREYNCTINLFYYHPFETSANSGQWGVLRRVNLINDMDNVRGINMSNPVFGEFPFQKQHRLNLNGMNMTVILFSSTNSYLRNEFDTLRPTIPKKAIDSPLNHSESYFGEDPEFFNQIRNLMNFTADISPTTDRKFYGYRVS